MAGPSEVQSGGNTGVGTATVSLTFTLGNFLIAVGGSAAAISIGDSLGNTWTALPVSGGSTSLGAWTAPVTTGGADVVTFTGATHTCGVVIEVTGQAASSPIETSAAAQGTTTSPISGATGVPVNTNDLCVGLVAGITGNGVPNNAVWSPSITGGSPGVTGAQFATTVASAGAWVTMNSAVAESYTPGSAGLLTAWSCWCLLIKSPGADLFVPKRPPTHYLGI